jgi:hypothetical protein
MASDLSKEVACAIKSKYHNYNAIIYIDRAYSILNK